MNDTIEMHFNGVASVEDWFFNPETHTPDDLMRQFEKQCIVSPDGNLPSFMGLAHKINDRNSRVWPTRADQHEDDGFGLCRTLWVAADGISTNLSRKGKGPNPYHNAPHSGHVLSLGHYLDQFLRIRVQQITRLSDEKLDRLLLKAAVARVDHDADHPGGKNSARELFEFELIHANVSAHRMTGQGCSKQDIDDVKLMILATSINGGAQYVKRAALALARGQKLDHNSLCIQVWATLPENLPVTWHNFKEQMEILRPLCEGRQKVIFPALLVHLSDVMPSILAPVPGSVNLSREHREHYGEKALDFNTYGARQYFLQNVVEIDLLREIFPELSAFDVAFDPKWRGFGYPPFDEYGVIVKPEGPEINGHA